MKDFWGTFARRTQWSRFGGRPREILQRVETQYEHFASFAGGYDVRDSREDVPAQSSPFALDIEVTRDDALRRTPGIAVRETLTGKSPLPQLVLHASLGNRAELVLFDPPWIGVKGSGSVVWYDVGLAGERPFAVTNFGGTLLFSSGTSKVLARQPGAVTVEEVVRAPVARSYATFAARVFAGGAIVDGQYEPLGVAWSAANSDYRDWEGTGAGNELLISNVETGDRVVKLVPMGLDFLAILCRKSIWLGSRTGLVNRPADFQPRVPGVGVITEQGAVATRVGVFLLSDDGVYLFDGNQAHMASEQINTDLLPIDYGKLYEYSLHYNPFSELVYVLTPTATWVFDILGRRWSRRRMVAKAAATFAEQYAAVTWGGLTGLWSEQGALRWTDYAPPEGQEFEQWFLGVEGGEYKLGVEDRTALTTFGVAVDPIWETPVRQSVRGTQLVLMNDVAVAYTGSGYVELALPDNASEFVPLAMLVPLVEASVPEMARIQPTVTGRGVGMRVRIVVGDPLIRKLAVGYILRGDRLDDVPLTQLYFAVDPVSGHLYPQSSPTARVLRQGTGESTLHVDDSRALTAAQLVVVDGSRAIIY